MEEEPLSDLGCPSAWTPTGNALPSSVEGGIFLPSFPFGEC